MIDNSSTWKCDLERTALDLERRKDQRRWPESSFAKVEKLLFGGAFAVRKLIESQKISDQIEASTVMAEAFPMKGRYVDRFNRDKIEKLYDLEAPSSVSLGLESFCNQLIHSFVMLPVRAYKSGLQGVFVASDRERGRRCFFFAIDAIADAFRRVALDDIVWFESRRDVGAEMIIARKSNRLSADALPGLVGPQ